MNEIPPLDALVTPAAQVFINNENWRAFCFESNEWVAGVLASGWTQTMFALVGAMFGALVAAVFVKRMLPRSPFMRIMLSVWFCGMTYVGITKVGSILARSGSDDGVTLVSAECGVTNGYSFVEVMATGGDPAPMWYREVTSNEWTLATDNGWISALADHSGSVYSREWRHTDTNDAVIAHQMWYFGLNPPSVEIIATGGVQIVSALFSGKLVKFTWYVPGEITLPPGASITLQNIFLDDNLPAWSDVQTLPVDHATNETSVVGFFLDRRTAWRIRLEVPL